MNKQLRFFATMLLLAIVGMVSADTYTYELTKDDFVLKPSKLTNTFAGITWTCTTDGNFLWFDNNNGRGFQFGSSKKPATKVILSGSGINGTITSITVNAATTNKGKAKLSVSVSGINYGEEKELTGSAADYTFNGVGSGEVKIMLTNSESQALYIKSITIEYSTSGEIKQAAGLAFATTSYETNLEEAFANPELKNPNNLTVTYSSNNEGVATVDPSSGAVTLKGEGTVQITAKSQETKDFYAGTASYTINVKDPRQKTSIYFKDYEIEVEVGKTYTNETHLRDSKKKDITGVQLTYSSDNESVATVDPVTGEVTGIKEGKVNIEASFAGNEKYKPVKKTYPLTVISPSEVSLTITDAGYATISSIYPLDFTNVSDVTLLAVKKHNENQAYTEEIAEKVIAANVGLLVKGAEGTYQIPVSIKKGATPANNELKAVADKDIVADGTQFVLSNYTGELGFFPVKKNDILKKNTAYLPYTGTAPAKGFTLSEGNATGISQLSTANEKTNAPIYNVAGQRVSENYKGIVIVNGKKIIKK